MQDDRQEQVEALETLKEYNVKIVKALSEVGEELRGNRKEDTDEYLDYIFKGVNWELQVLNQTLDLLNEKEDQISRDSVNVMVQQLNDAYTSKADEKLALVVENELYPFFQGLNQKIDNIL